MTDEIRTTYEVPEDNLETLKVKIAALNKKAAKLAARPITLSEVSFEDRPIVNDEGDDTGLVRRWYTVEVVGEAPKLEGWYFVATIQHEPAGNILRTVPGEDAPEEFRTRDARCEHCKKIRNRKDTYIVRNEDNEYAQVGRQCLRDFTGVNSPQKAAALAEYLIELDEQFNDFLFDPTPRGEYRMHILKVLGWTAAVIREKGWVSRSASYESGRTATAGYVVNGLLDGKKFSKNSGIWLTEEDEAKAEEILEWGRSHLEKDDLNEYEWNMKVAITDDAITYRSLGLVCSLVSMHWRETEAQRKRENKKESNWIGEIKVRQEFKDLYLNVVIITEGYYGATYIHKFTDAAGNEIVWFASKWDLDEEKFYSGKATVKDHNEFNGMKQTIITRAKFKEVEGETQP